MMKVGDLVLLKSGSPVMTIAGTPEHTLGGAVRTIWYDGDGFKEAYFKKEMLVFIDK